MKTNVSFVLLSLFAVLFAMTSCGGEDEVAVTDIRLDKEMLILLKGDNEKLFATVSPENATNSTVVWSSSSPSVVSVDANGNVNALSVGYSRVTATSADGKVSATCTVIVNVRVTTLTLSDESITLDKGSERIIVPTFVSNETTDKTVVWSSSDTSVVTVDANGKIKAIDGGNAVITAKAAGGKVSATCAVTVTVPVECVSIDKSTLTLVKGQSEMLSAVVLPSNATLKDVLWTSSDKSVALVDNGKVEAVGVGTSVITVMSAEGNKIATCTVTVNKSEYIDYNPYGEGQKW